MEAVAVADAGGEEGEDDATRPSRECIAPSSGDFPWRRAKKGPAIRDRSPEAARSAMRRHLTNSLKRYRKLAEDQKAR